MTKLSILELFNKEAINLIASEQPTTCPYDGARTDHGGSGLRNGTLYQVEYCPECSKVFHVYEPEPEEEEEAEDDK